jgi:hypothetical protein
MLAQHRRLKSGKPHLPQSRHDWDRLCRSFSRERCRIAGGRGDHGDSSADHVSHQRRQAIVLAPQPVVLDRHVLAFDVAGFVEAFAESGPKAGGFIGRPTADKPDHRHRLLRWRSQLPRRRAAEKHHEAEAGHDARSPTVRSTYDAAVKYARLDIVALDGTTFIARKDDPGVCPGEGWQLMSVRGKPGIKGPPGERGERGGKGDPGAPAPTILAWKVDRESYTVTPIMSDASEVPAIEMRALFEQFVDERG